MGRSLLDTTIVTSPKQRPGSVKESGSDRNATFSQTKPCLSSRANVEHRLVIKLAFHVHCCLVRLFQERSTSVATRCLRHEQPGDEETHGTIHLDFVSVREYYRRCRCDVRVEGMSRAGAYAAKGAATCTWLRPDLLAE